MNGGEDAPMSITVKDVEHVANLARLELSEGEKEQFTGQLNAILKYAEKLNELDTEQVEPTSHVLPVTNVMRDDVVKESVTVEIALKNAPDEEDGQFKVPAVLE
ncbi:Aspartyl/glutamyl-tRNA(Asn/Gln) amidotransferase subunit C [Paenibacillus plantiphilus]|uniref:Aspartyl/glutamyl-tRNA(Asn/Gln) amidotransferase subunit C n=2 Tax=Paenibacillus plantiphilus TaxID=2905650 RepID=A0ABM9C5Z9_9BACL|nr:Aspartyl/glutamyl-tRNA(Asn/Gln) amidotransferase subunit C [Paenibacillus plantiphilus]